MSRVVSAAAVYEQSPRADRPLAEAEVLTTFDGRRLALDFAVEPVIDLARLAAAGHFIEPRLADADTGRLLSPAERQMLLAADTERIDQAALALGLAHLEARRAQGDHPSLILGVSFTTASSQRARARLLQRPLSEREALRGAVIWLLTDLPDGAPTGRLTEVVSLLRPFGRAVFARGRLSAAALRTVQLAGIAGLLLEPSRGDFSDTDAAVWLLQAGKLAEGAAPALIAGALASEDLYPMALAAGFTHAIRATAASAAAESRVVEI
jgi:hypothetical protein